MLYRGLRSSTASSGALWIYDLKNFNLNDHVFLPTHVLRSASELTCSDKTSKTSVPRIRLKAWLATASCTWISYVWARCYHFTDSSVSNIGLRSVVSNAALSLSIRLLRFSQSCFVTICHNAKPMGSHSNPKKGCSEMIWQDVYHESVTLDTRTTRARWSSADMFIFLVNMINFKSRPIQATDRWKHLEVSMPLGLGMLVHWCCTPALLVILLVILSIQRTPLYLAEINLHCWLEPGALPQGLM